MTPGGCHLAAEKGKRPPVRKEEFRLTEEDIPKQSLDELVAELVQTYGEEYKEWLAGHDGKLPEGWEGG